MRGELDYQGSIFLLPMCLIIRVTLLYALPPAPLTNVIARALKPCCGFI